MPTHLRRKQPAQIALREKPLTLSRESASKAWRRTIIKQAIELESGGRTAPPDIDPTE